MTQQKSVQLFESDCKRAKAVVENDMPIGAFHDFLVSIKGQMIDRMIKQQKEDEEISKQMKEVKENDKS